jgi:hypothetical protein
MGVSPMPLRMKGTGKQRQDAAGISSRWKTSSIFWMAVSRTRRF